MNRNYHIISIVEASRDIPGYEKILVDNTKKIINHSATKIICTCLEYQDKTKLANTVNELLQKIKPQGQIDIVFTNFKQLFYDFLNCKIDAQKVFDHLRSKNTIVVAEDILTLIDTNMYRVVNYSTNPDYHTSIVIERITV